MKLHVDTHVATGEGFESVADFSIEMNEKAFTVLSDTIYKDKIGSIVRELSCNAFDAHVDAGIPETPFDIHLPDAFEPYFSIRDYGKGISPDDIKSIYTKYFASTKDQSNDVVGAFGLGSKTPFAYTDAFTVISIYNGVKTMYNAHKSRGLPAIVAYGESEPTDEPNGLEVRVSVEGMDYKAFQSAVKRQLKFFPVKPAISNGEIEWETYTPILEVDGFIYYTIDGAPSYGYYNRNYVTTGLFLKQGPVAYPVDFEALNQVLDSKGIKKSSFYTYLNDNINGYGNKGIIIDMPIGTVEVTASREGISYKDTTVNNIMKRLDQIARVISREVKKKLDEAYQEGVLEFAKMLDNLDSYFKHALVADDMKKRYPKFSFTDNVNGVRAHFKVPTSTFEGIEVRKYDIVSYQQPRATQTYTLNARLVNPNDKSSDLSDYINVDVVSLAGRTDNAGNNNVVYIKDIPNGFVARLQEYNTSSTVILLDIPNSNSATRDEIADALGDEFVVRLVSELPKVASKSRAGQGGHSITGGRQRLWFEVNLNNLENVFFGEQTCYAAGFEQVFGESFDEADKDKYAYFTTFNNKVDRNVVNFTEHSSLCKLFCEWLEGKGYEIVAFAGSFTDKAEATGKFHCINSLWKEYGDIFKDEAWDMFLGIVTNNYYIRVNNELSIEGWNSCYSIPTYNSWFKMLKVEDNDVLFDKFVQLRDNAASRNYKQVTNALRDLIVEDQSKVDTFTKLNSALGSRYSDEGSLKEVEKLLIDEGVELLVVGSELIDDYIELIKEHIASLLAVSPLVNDSIKLERVKFRDPIMECNEILTHEDVVEALKKKLEIGA